VVFLALVFLLDRRPQFRVDFMQGLAGIEHLSISHRSESGILACSHSPSVRSGCMVQSCTSFSV